MRISDWSSDVCSSDLVPPHRAAVPSFRAVAESSDRTARPHRPGRCCPGTFHWAPAPVRRPPHRHRAPTPRVALPAGKGARPGSTATCLGDADRRSAKLRKAESQPRSEEHTSELQSLMRLSYAVFCLKKKYTNSHTQTPTHHHRHQ